MSINIATIADQSAARAHRQGNSGHSFIRWTLTRDYGELVIAAGNRKNTRKWI